ncbi:MAG: Flp pilus assembly complex ATPase component TadA [Tatlockia sp.]|nr:Flp pilus assembly complex ATPase component TadA [Tatlockia sp.]
MDMATNPTEQYLHGIAQLLTQENRLSKDEAINYQQLALDNEQSFSCYLVNQQIIAASTLSCIVSQHFGLPVVDLASINLDSIPVELVSEELIHRHRIVPLSVQDGYLYLATDDPSKHNAFKDIQFHTGLALKIKVAEADKLSLFIANLLNKKDAFKLKAKDDDAPIIELVNQIIEGAIKKKVSDIHFEPYENEYRIRYRQDGLLSEIAKPPLHLATRISARLKIMANLDIAERRKPQDGRFQLRLMPDHAVDFRVSTCPTINGEKIAIRILDTNYTQLDIDVLGLNASQKMIFLQSLAKPQGLILVTGPTGSGKSLTLYTAISRLNTNDRNISTAEDPVEIKIPGINQVNINPKIGINFSNILRAFLRQDPDIIMVGEIRDRETAELAIKAAQTGHLVFSTLHTNSAAETLTRLSNLGIEVFNIVNSLSLIIAQRLVRRLCELCKVVRDDLSFENLIQLGFNENEAQGLVVYKASGCPQCTHGYRGRLGLFELMPITKTMGILILSGANSYDILKLAKAEGLISIYQSGLEKIKQGLTTFEDLNRVTVQ